MIRLKRPPDASGFEAHFWRVNTKQGKRIGVKACASKAKAQTMLKRQQAFAKTAPSFAPPCSRTLERVTWSGRGGFAGEHVTRHLWGYRTGLATVASHVLSALNMIRWETDAEGRADLWDDLDQMAHLPDTLQSKVVQRDLQGCFDAYVDAWNSMSAINRTLCCSRDMHDDNWGFYNGRPVAIDFGPIGSMWEVPEEQSEIVTDPAFCHCADCMHDR